MFDPDVLFERKALLFKGGSFKVANKANVFLIKIFVSFFISEFSECVDNNTEQY